MQLSTTLKPPNAHLVLPRQASAPAMFGNGTKSKHANFGGDWMAPCVPRRRRVTYIDFGFNLRPAPFPVYPAQDLLHSTPSITVIAIQSYSSTGCLRVLKSARSLCNHPQDQVKHGVKNYEDAINEFQQANNLIDAGVADVDFNKLVRAELTRPLTIWPKSWLPGGAGPTLDPFAIEPGIQGTTSWLPVSTDVWGTCQFQAVTTCVTIGGSIGILKLNVILAAADGS
ncbi:hypothetical protein K438DRAFT_1951061 [Mycena galopus ATCC 62051]|nr:hypothetical protein K438DRAFT_1951061 [Mycena galopus ATCC 62051]